MSIQRYDSNGYMDKYDYGDAVFYADHAAEVERLKKALRKIEEVAQNAADDPMGPWSVFSWIINHANDAIEGK